MATQQKLIPKSVGRPSPSARLGHSRPSTAALAHLGCMKSTTRSETGLGPVLTWPQLASQLGVSIQTMYDLRSQGRGPRGFRVGRELRFRVSEVDAWLAKLEADDADRHPRRDDPLEAKQGRQCQEAVGVAVELLLPPVVSSPLDWVGDVREPITDCFFLAIGC